MQTIPCNWRSRFLERFVFLTILLFSFLNSSGTHLRSIQIEVKKIDPCSGTDFEITLKFYLNSETNVKAGAGRLDYGDGNFVLTPELESSPRPDLGQNVSVAEFSISHGYVSHGTYRISYTEQNRNSGIVNISNSVSVPYSTFVQIQTSFDCNNFPVLPIAPTDRSCGGVAFYHSTGAIDADGDSLHFELVTPLQAPNQQVSGYLSPIHPSFYSDFQNGVEGGGSPPTLTIDPNTGLIAWNAPGKAGEYIIALKVEEWRTDEISGEHILLSTTIRDMMVVVEDCPNNRPELTIPEDICVEAGTIINEKFFGSDPDNDHVKIEFFSDAFSLPVEPPILIPSTVEFRPSNPANEVQFHWKTDCLHVRDQPYFIVVKITDKPAIGAPLVTFRTWRIKVIAPAPRLKDVTLDLAKRQAIVEWEPYVCTNAQYIQVWRKVGQLAYVPGECDAGLPRHLGYELVTQLNPTDTIFSDNNSTIGLEEGALYCYRLVAVFELPAGGKSYVTTEQCVGPIKVDAPVITHVTVEATDKMDGSIRVSWRSPFEIDVSLFPKPYQYHIYRGDGFVAETGLTKIGEVLGDTTFLNNGIDTNNKVYNYRIVVYSKPVGYSNFIAVDTSATASSVRLTGSPGAAQIELSWDAVVPWSNVIGGASYHIVFRGSKDDVDLKLLTSVDVTQNGFTFKDNTVESNKYYCYTVMTIGTYGNPDIDTLKNFSQKICLYPVNDLVPCPPSLRVEQTNCDELFQSSNCITSFTNNLNWTPVVTPGCREDVESYNVYASNLPDGNFEKIHQGLSETYFNDTGLPSFARCYKVTTVDSRGVESEPGEAVCNDNCPVFELPTVFTPGVSDGYNDTFHAYNGIPSGGGESGSSPCLYFIKSVRFNVFNRWGMEVFSSSTNTGLPKEIKWNGKNDIGKELDAGIYFYKAEVDFDVLNPSNKNKTMKGWVYLVR